jgi:hypothetical protein
MKKMLIVVLSIILCICCESLRLEAGDLNSKLLKSTKKGELENVKQLFVEGASVNSADKSGRTALMFAIEKRQVAIFIYLLENGADYRISDNKDISAEKMAEWKKKYGGLNTMRGYALLIDFEKAKSINTFEAYDSFLKLNHQIINDIKMEYKWEPYNLDANLLTSRIQQIENQINAKIDSIYEEFSKYVIGMDSIPIDSVSVYTAFLKNFPEGKHTEEILDKIKESIKSEFHRVSAINTLEAYQEFQMHPIGQDYIDSTISRIEQIKYAETIGSIDERLLEGYLKLYKGKFQHKRDIPADLEPVLREFSVDYDDNYWHQVDVAYRLATLRNSDEAYLEFIRAYPKAKEVYSLLKKLQGYNVLLAGEILPIEGMVLLINQEDGFSDFSNAYVNNVIYKSDYSINEIHCAEGSELYYPNLVRISGIIFRGELVCSDRKFKIKEGFGIVMK